MRNLNYLIGAYLISGLILGLYWIYLIFWRPSESVGDQSGRAGKDPENG